MKLDKSKKRLSFALLLVGLTFNACYRVNVSTSVGSPEDFPTLASTRSRIDETLELVLRHRQLDAEVHAAWQVLHGVLAYGRAFPVLSHGKSVSAIEYLQGGGYLNGWKFSPGDRLDGNRVGLRAVPEPGSFAGQGHSDQWFAILAQTNLNLELPIIIQEKSHLLDDFLQQVKLDVPFNPEQEWSWTLIGLTNYLPTSAKWIAGDGNSWSVEKLVEAESQQELNSSACGGTHRLIGVSMALDKGKSEQRKMNQIWQDADMMVRNAASLAKQYQNADGSFSTNYFQRPGISADNAQVLATTGHTLEFLAISLDAQELRQPWMIRAVQRLCDVLEDSKQLPLECGSLYHAAHGLVVYREKAFGSE